jgi:hypothetical protein
MSAAKHTYSGGGKSTREAQVILPDELAELASSRRNGAAINIEVEGATGCFNWWEISNARIVGEACDRWFERQYERTKDRLINSREYALARHNRDYTLAVQARITAAKAAETEQKNA